jgi:hypothetical protein
MRIACLACAATALTLATSACGSRAQQAGQGRENPPGPFAARVGDEVIAVRQVEALLVEARQSFRARKRVFPAQSDPYYADLRDEAVRYLVERTLREQLAEQLGVEFSGELDFDTYQAISASRKSGETVREALSRWRKVLEKRFDEVTYVSPYRPAEHRRSIPPELRTLPKPKASCDLKKGFYPYLVARAHGCLGSGDEDVSYDIPPCPEIPAGAVDDGFTDAEVSSGYADYVMDSAGQDFFEPLTTNREDLASVASGDGPECQPFVGEEEVSIGIRLGGRPPFSIPGPRPAQSPTRQ